MPKCDFNFIEIALWHVFPPLSLLDIFRTPILKNTSGGLRLIEINLNQRCKIMATLMWNV